ncbi:MAG: hypothetical protein IPH13_17620 [Planctomycetes bacterium]|nr:hypothetical protein [Planctomycetota bacterium]
MKSKLWSLGVAIVIAFSQNGVSGVAGEVVHADGRRERVEDPRVGSNGQWTATIDGRRTPLKAGEIVVVIDDAGVETITIPPTADEADSPEVTALLAGLRDAKNDAWMLTLDRLGARPTKTLQAALDVLVLDPSKEMRKRGIHALTRLRTREGTIAAAKAVLAEKDKALRRETASALFSVEEIFRRCEGVAESVKQGMADTERDVRFVFAMLSAKDDPSAIAILKKDGLGNPDHHVRESAALELGRRGNVAGEKILIGILDWTKLDVSDDPALNERLLAEQQTQVCEVLGTFESASAKAALEKARKSKLAAVREAAERALKGKGA